MEINRINFKCKIPCAIQDRCARIPLELHGADSDKEHKIDIMFITEFPGKEEAKEQAFIVGKYGDPVRNILSRLEKDYDFTYAITGLFKAQSWGDDIQKRSRDIKTCGTQLLYKEIKYCNPKIIVSMGVHIYKFLHGGNLPDFGMLVENSRIHTCNIPEVGTFKVLTTQHSSWHQVSDPCLVDILYEDIRKAIHYVQDDKWDVPNKFESDLIEKESDLKNIINDMGKNTTRICVDTETENLGRVYDNKVISLQLCNDGKTGYVIPLDHYNSPFKTKLNTIKNIIHDFFVNKNSKSGGYLFVNAKFDYHQLIREFKVLKFPISVIDCSFAEYSLEENWTRVRAFPKGKGKFSLFTMAYTRNFSFYADTAFKEKRTILKHLPLNEWVEYAGADVVAPYNIYKSQMKQAKAQGYLKKFRKLNEVFFPHLLKAITYCEHSGLGIDTKVLQKLDSNDGIFTVAIKDVMDRFYKSENVIQTNDELVKQKTGCNSMGLFGNTKIFDPKKIDHRKKLYFDILGLEPLEGDDNKNSNSTDKDFQKAYSNIPEVSLLSEYNTLNKMKTGFVTPLTKWIFKDAVEANPDFYEDSRCRTSFFYTTVTGRLLSTSPNCQQRVSRGKYTDQILELYSPSKGKCLVKLDHSTFEVRGLGFISRDKAMVSSFNKMHDMKMEFRNNPEVFFKEGYKDAKKELIDTKKAIEEKKEIYIATRNKDDIVMIKEEIAKYKEAKDKLLKDAETDKIKFSMKYLKFMTDFHRRSASLFNNIPINKVTSEMRQSAKGLVFGSIYGRSVDSIAKELGISEELAQEYFDLFVNNMPEAVEWMEKIKKKGMNNIYVESPLGRRRRLGGYLVDNKTTINKMDRLGVNTLIQGFCSDMTLIGTSFMIDYAIAMNRSKYQVPDERAWFSTNLIHDSHEGELPVFDVYYALKNFERFFTTDVMDYVKKEFGFEVTIPLEVDFTVGSTYSNTLDWNGSDIHARELQKWILEACSERDQVDYTKYYKKAISGKLIDL